MNRLHASHLIAWLSLGAILVPARAAAQSASEQLAARAREILQKHCFECHGKNPKKIKGDLNVFDPAHLNDKDRQIVVPRDPDKSGLIVYVEDGSMPKGQPKLSAQDRKALRDWVAAGAPPLPGDVEKSFLPARDDSAVLASQVKEIFRRNCLECHGDTAPKDGVKVLDRDNLVKRRKVFPGKADSSRLVVLLTKTGDDAMPPGDRPRLSQGDIEIVSRWIDKGASPLPPEVPVPAEPRPQDQLKDIAGVDYVLKKVLAHVQGLDLQDRRFYRYFSINHILTGGATAAELQRHRDALAKAINHLTWESRIVRPEPIDSPTDSVYCLKISKLGWQAKPFTRMNGDQAGKTSPLNLYDLVLLEYPYAIVYEDSRTFDRLAEEFLIPVGQVRPIPYVRADWFASMVTQPPLYEDLLQLPFTQAELEKLIDVDPEGNIRDGQARRAGITNSGVSRNNRVVERHPLKRGGSYWKSFDFRTSKGRENMFGDPINLNPTGGEFIFSLPNGLQGYFVADARGRRLEAAPTDIVTDKNASDKTVRNGLACMRCHEQGMKRFEDVVRPALLRLPGSPGFDRRAALDLYPEKAENNRLLQEDEERFLKAMTEVLGKQPTEEPLTNVSHRYLDDALGLPTAAGELGLVRPEELGPRLLTKGFAGLGLVPLADKGMVRRDSWEDYYDLVVRELGLGIPLVPLDGLNRLDYPAGPVPFEVELKTSKRTGVTEAGERVSILVVNKSARPVFIELIGTGVKGNKMILAASDTVVEPGKTYTFPTDGKGMAVQPDKGKEQITLFASDAEFPRGELLRGKGTTDRVVHSFYRLESRDGRIKLPRAPGQIVKKTIDIETR